MAIVRCKECGQSISSKAAVCPQCGAPRSQNQISTGAGCLIILLSIPLLAWCFSGSFFGKDDQPATPRGGSEAVIAPEKPKTLTAGDVGVLRIDGGGDVLVAVTEQDLDRFTKLAVAEDEYGLGEM